ncbi:hypothetical protein [Streptomyces sp. NPDC000410]|uniref:hypothetical protein n=1 Tax=Streptomyces sp. NPDC000410 TaxID=3154254 RepID=UPI00332AC162
MDPCPPVVGGQHLPEARQHHRGGRTDPAEHVGGLVALGIVVRGVDKGWMKVRHEEEVKQG